MKSLNLISLAVVISSAAVFFSDQSAAYSQATCAVSDSMVTRCSSLPFRYIEIENAPVSPTSRHIVVFMDPTAFRQDNLTFLFLHLSEKNREPHNLTVIVETSWKHLPLMTKCRGVAVSDSERVYAPTDSYHATFYRRARKEKSLYFVYNPELTEYKTVELKR